MHRKRKNSGLIAKDPRCTVALEHVQIKNQQSLYPALGQEQPRRDRQIIEYTKSRTIGRKGVVGAPSGITGNAVLQRQLRRENGAPYRCAGAFAQIGAPGQADAPLGFGIEGASAIGLHIVGLVHLFNPRLRRGTGLINLVGGHDAILQ